MVASRSAGSVSRWLTDMRAALQGRADATVACDGCTACCASSQFVHVGPDETDTLAHIPPALLFPAPGRPRGEVLMGYDQHGRCPMLGEAGCSIYAHRPRSCRSFDCRIFTATGIDADADKPLITAQARRWHFDLDDDDDAVLLDALRAAARFVARHRDREPFRSASRTQTALAVMAVERCEEFRNAAPGDEAAGAVSDDSGADRRAERPSG